MGLKSFLLNQLGQPGGWFAPITARALNRGNATQNSDCIDALELGPESSVLDIGFGGGVSFSRLLRECSSGRVAGSDISLEMVERARSVWSREIAAGRLEVRHCGVDSLGFEDGSFDRVMTVNTLYFWPDVSAGLQEIQRVLAHQGRFAASIVPEAVLRKIGFAEMGFRTKSHEFYAGLMRDAGYVNVRTLDTGDGKRSVLLVGDKPPEPDATDRQQIASSL